MTRRGKGQERGSAESEERQRDTTTVRLPLPRTRGAPGTCPPARPRDLTGVTSPADVPVPPLGQGRKRSHLSVRQGRADATTRPRHGPLPGTRSNSHKKKAGGLEGVRDPRGEGRHGWWPRGRPTPRKGRRGPLEARRGAEGPRAPSKLRSHFCPHPLQPTSQCYTGSHSFPDSASHNDNRTHPQALT